MGDYHVQIQADVDADPATVHRALTTQEGVRGWWSTHADGPADGRLEVGFPYVPRPFEFEVRQGDPARVEWVVGAMPPPWAGTTVRWEVGPNPDGAGTRVHFSHRDFDRDNPVIPVVTPVWSQVVLRLKSYAETGRPQPFFDF